MATRPQLSVSCYRVQGEENPDTVNADSVLLVIANAQGDSDYVKRWMSRSPVMDEHFKTILTASSESIKRQQD